MKNNRLACLFMPRMTKFVIFLRVLIQ